MSLFARLKAYFTQPAPEDNGAGEGTDTGMRAGPAAQGTLEDRIGPIHLYTGDAAGKTSAALGRALRAVGHGQRVVIVQFLKGRKDIGEYLIQGRLSPEYEIHQYGTEHFIDPDNPGDEDRELAKRCLEDIGGYLASAPDVLILDEVCYACACGLIEAGDVVGLLKDKPRRTYVILTGRGAPQELIEIADIATELIDLKQRGCTALEGVEY